MVVILVIVALLLRPGGRTLKSGEAEVAVHGVAVVQRAAGSRETITDRVLLHSGDVITLQQGSATITANDATYEARSGREGRPDTRFRMGRLPELQAGELLVDAATAITVQSAGTLVNVGDGTGGAARLVRTLAFGVSVYRGVAEINSAGSRLRIPRLRAAEVVSLGQVPASLAPLRYQATDPWDRHYLEPAITVDQELDPMARAFDKSSPGAVTPASLHVRSLPPPSQLQSLIDKVQRIDGALTSPSDAIVGASIATLGSRGTLDTRWTNVFRFHADGARWGLVAMDQGVDADALVSAVRHAIDQVPLSFAAPSRAAGPITPPVASAAPPSLQAPPSESPSRPAEPSPPTTRALPGTPPTAAAPQPTLTLPPVTVPTLPPVLPPNSTNPLQGVVDTATGVLSGLLNTIAGPKGLLHP